MVRWLRWMDGNAIGENVEAQLEGSFNNKLLLLYFLVKHNLHPSLESIAFFYLQRFSLHLSPQLFRLNLFLFQRVRAKLRFLVLSSLPLPYELLSSLNELSNRDKRQSMIVPTKCDSQPDPDFHFFSFIEPAILLSHLLLPRFNFCLHLISSRICFVRPIFIQFFSCVTIQGNSVQHSLTQSTRKLKKARVQ